MKQKLQHKWPSLKKNPASKSSTSNAASVPILRSQGKHKDVKERSKAGDVDKRKKVHVPPKVGASSSSADTYKKAS